MLRLIIMFYAMLVLAALIALKLAYDEFKHKREVRCQYCENASRPIHRGFGGFVHEIDGWEYECERPMLSPSREVESIRLRPSLIASIAARLFRRPSHLHP